MNSEDADYDERSHLFEGGDEGAEQAAGEGEGEAAAEGENAEPEVERSAGAKVGNMKAGDYTIHILVQNARNLIADGDDTCDPVIEFDVNGVTGKTSAKNDITRSATTKFNEHVFLELKGLTDVDARNAQLKMKVVHQGFFMSDLVGQFELPVSKVYNMPDHCMLNQQLGLNDPEAENASEIKGFVAVSINVQGPDDEAHELNMASEKVIMEKVPLIPTAIKKSYKQAYFRFYYAQNLPTMDMDLTGGLLGGEKPTIDAYAKIKYGTCQLKTKVYTQKDEEIVWMQEMLLPIEIPVKTHTIQIQVWDEDKIGRDELCVSLDVPVEDLLSLDQGASHGHMLRWINLYGGPNDYSGATRDWMNRNPDKASEWKGRIMAEYFVENAKYPKAKMEDLQKDRAKFEKLKADLAITMKEKEYYVIGQISSGIALPDEDTEKNKYEIKVSIGKRSWSTGKAKQNECNYARWDHEFEETFQDSYQHVDRLPDVFVYLMIKGKPACYFRRAITDFIDPNPKWRWFEFTADKAVNVVKDQWRAGFFALRLYVRSNAAEGRPFVKAKDSVWSKGFEKRNRGYLIRCAIYQCSLLPPADSNGTSDPYVEIWQPDVKKIRTETSSDTNNPIYYELKEFYVEKPRNVDLDEAPPIILNIFDTDEGFLDAEDDYMGRAVIFLHEIENDDQINDGALDKLPFRGLSITDDIPYPQFFPIKRKTTDDWDPATGPSILCSFSIVDYSKKYKVPTEEIDLEVVHEIKPGVRLNMPDLKIKEFKCKVTVLGLRELVSPGILPIRKSYVKFNLKSLLKAETAKGVENIQTLPKEPGNNPNMKTKIEFEVRISEDRTFCPQMTCDVFDQLYFEGLPQPQIGTFTLKVGHRLFEMMEEDEEEKDELEKLNYILSELKKMLQQQQGDNEERKRTAELLPDIRKKADTQIMSSKDRRESRMLQLDPERGSDLALADGVAEQAPDQASQASNVSKSQIQPNLEADTGEKTQKQLRDEYLAEQKKKAQEEEDARIADQEALAKSKTGFANIIDPIYKWDDRLNIDVEVEFPPEKIFMPVGYNEKKPDDGEQGNKHYRRYFPNELENVQDPNGDYLVVSPFLSEHITRCQTAEKKKTGLLSFFGGGSGDPAEDEGPEFEVIKAGKFKGVLKVFNEAHYNNRKQEILDEVFKLQMLFKECYDLELALHGKSWEFDLDRIHPEKVEGYQEMKTALSDLKDLLQDAGLGSLKLEKKMANVLYDAQLQKKLEKSITCKVRGYILEGFNFAKKDLFSESDPFLIVKCGAEEFNEEENYQMNNASPKFNKCYEFQMDFPGASPLEIWAYDYDSFFGNDLIGRTQVDLDDRFFSQEWQSINNKPVEYRDLYHVDFQKSQGTVKMWVEIAEMANKSSKAPATFCAGEPAKLYEARLVVWKTRDIPHMDVEGCSDVFIRSYFDDPNKDKLTDTHWRNSDGKASFNWRTIFQLESLQEDYKLTVQAWDKDIIASNDLIGEFTLDIGPLFRDAYLTGRQQNLTKGYWDSYMKQKLLDDGDDRAKLIEFDGKDEMEGTAEKEWQKFWFPISRYDVETSKQLDTGYIQCTLHIYPQADAEKNPQGVGRDAPNSDPFCPDPEGRITFSLNPFTMLMQLIPPKLRRRICCGLCCAVCCALCLMMAPMIISNLVSTGVAAIFS